MKYFLLGLVFILTMVAAALTYHYKKIEIPHFEQSTLSHSSGSFHVHSSISHDSRLSLEDIAHAAQHIGQDFVVLTDHNKILEKSVLIDGVLLFAASELTTEYGHLISLGASNVPPKDKRLNKNVIQNLHTLGGFGIIAHPADEKLPWKGPIADGIEIVSASSAGRRIGGPTWLGALPLAVVYAANPRLALAQLYDRDDGALQLWDKTSATIGFCGDDAHGWFDLSLNLQAWNLVLEEKLQGNSHSQAIQLKNLLTTGKFFCAAGVFGNNPNFVWMPGHIIGPNLPHQQIVLYKDGQIFKSSMTNTLAYSITDPGLYRVEIHTKIPDLKGHPKDKVVIYSQRQKVFLP